MNPSVWYIIVTLDLKITSFTSSAEALRSRLLFRERKQLQELLFRLFFFLYRKLHWHTCRSSVESLRSKQVRRGLSKTRSPCRPWILACSSCQFWEPIIACEASCMIKVSRGVGVVTPSKPPAPYEQLLPLLTPCFKMLLERSLNDPLPPYFKHLSLLPPPPPHPPPLPP